MCLCLKSGCSRGGQLALAVYDLVTLVLSICVWPFIEDPTDNEFGMAVLSISIASVVLNATSVLLLVAFYCNPQSTTLGVLNFAWQIVMLLQVLNVTGLLALASFALISLVCSDAPTDAKADCESHNWWGYGAFCVYICVLGLTIQALIIRCFYRTT